MPGREQFIRGIGPEVYGEVGWVVVVVVTVVCISGRAGSEHK